jgi:hypothetical protein
LHPSIGSEIVEVIHAVEDHEDDTNEDGVRGGPVAEDNEGQIYSIGREEVTSATLK